MATRFPEFNDEELLELLDRSKNMIKYSVAVLSSYATTRNGVPFQLAEFQLAELAEF